MSEAHKQQERCSPVQPKVGDAMTKPTTAVMTAAAASTSTESSAALARLYMAGLSMPCAFHALLSKGLAIFKCHGPACISLIRLRV